MADAGSALMGIGSARGEDRSVAAAEMAVSSPLLEASIDGAHGVLLSIAGGSDLGLFEINEAAALVAEAVHPEANIIFGATIDDALGDEVRVTVIAAGFDGGTPKRKAEGSVLRRDQPAQTQAETLDAAEALGEAKRSRGRQGAGHRRGRRPRRPRRRARPRCVALLLRRRRPGRPRLPEVGLEGDVRLPHQPRPRRAVLHRPVRRGQPGRSTAQPARRDRRTGLLGRLRAGRRAVRPRAGARRATVAVRRAESPVPGPTADALVTARARTSC